MVYSGSTSKQQKQAHGNINQRQQHYGGVLAATEPSKKNQAREAFTADFAGAPIHQKQYSQVPMTLAESPLDAFPQMPPKNNHTINHEGQHHNKNIIGVTTRSTLRTQQQVRDRKLGGSLPRYYPKGCNSHSERLYGMFGNACKPRKNMNFHQGPGQYDSTRGNNRAMQNPNKLQ